MTTTQAANVSIYAADKLISEARRIAAEYRRTTGKSLGISSEIARHDACKLLKLEPCEEGGGYDAIGRDSRDGQRIQIKGRVMFSENKSGQRIGQLKLEQEWDSVVLVLMDDDFATYEIYQADREEILDALEENDNSKRSKRGAMSVARFKRIGRLVWHREEGPLDNRDDEQLD